MRGSTLARLFLGVAATASCVEVAAPDRQPPEEPGPITQLRLRLQPIPAPGWEHTFVGGDLTLRVAVLDARGVEQRSAGAELSLSDPTVASLIVNTIYDVVGQPMERQAKVEFLREGSVKVIARLGAAADTFAITVGPRPPLSTAIQVDSFAVIEHRYDCAVDCWYIVYAPVLRLRNASPSEARKLEWGRVTLASSRTSRCAIDHWFPPGLSQLYGRLDEYLWNNGLLFVAGDERIAADSASFEMLVRSLDGRAEMVEATGPVLPLESGATPPQFAEHWGC